MVNESHEQGYIEDNEAEMINNIFEFGDKQAKDIMTDRSNIVAIDVSTKLSDALEVMLDANNSRFPVYDGDLDHIVGIIHLKDAMRLYRVKGNPLKRIDSIDGILREARCIPQTRKIDKLFSVMQATKLQMVVVIDEYGQTSGIVAMRDILEEIVGNILDEYDLDEDMIVEHGNDKYIIEGITPLEDLEKKLMIKFETDEFETINGFLISKMERIPDKKTKFDVTVDGYNFKVLEVNHNMIQQVLVTKDSDTVSEKADVKEE
ncbi:MAG: HlyC/CorC family transporter [Lachnospiraceae bacterium]|nr:HlyC/CorC family transporter [Candidatus Colinaster equi]